ncbi:hypothetical protein LTR10_024368 [Elasticomyces elasticus]|uniref:Glycosyltransferase family 34 protein n=1 Tax=Exophiala sideris TaxID=1016849 RepID=A0ABR0IUQ8_9EURO|nr:hypothetical protein LTR10_024368 [Elasticomyces elasticus]KAK5020704.1 hypothetical protein LTS07_011474 [Exophiala sideris]KAK5022588.1 hypothetical protein LTR13_011435 [Exophiala sideris]KAK5047857.1 hypothetical protein LTR69_011468 [Exophiala sideris]KAK5175967.1 hypothetical protein LTR44_011470 [Eurotiomycetes sp. CCFEE 6388]
MARPYRMSRPILLAIAIIIFIGYASRSTWQQPAQPNRSFTPKVDLPTIPKTARPIAYGRIGEPFAVLEDAAQAISTSSTWQVAESTPSPQSPNTNALVLHDETLGAAGEGTLYSKIGKVTMLYYNKPTKDSFWYEKALSSQKEHNLRHGYKQFVLRSEIVPEFFSKQAFILSILLQELAKPTAERLEWLFWHDVDLVLVNAQIPLELFTPPPEFSHIHHIVASDLNGLNAGVFFLRVHPWSLRYLSAIISYQDFHPDKWLRYQEQTAMEWLVQEWERWGQNTTHVPQRWFNAYHNFGTDDSVPPEWEWKNGYHEPGDMLVHLPGSGDSRPDLIREWMDKVRNDNEKWEVPLSKTSYEKNVTEFWRTDARKEKELQDTYWRRWHLLIELGSHEDDLQREAVKRAEQDAEEQDLSDEMRQNKIHEVKEKYKKLKIKHLREAERVKMKEEGLLEDNNADEETKHENRDS